MKNILMVIAEKNFRDTEYLTPKAFFEGTNAKVMTASSNVIANGRFGFKVKDNLLFKEVNPAKFDGIFIVGGGGILNYLDNQDLKDLVGKFDNSQKAIGAICAAPRLLLNWGILKNKKFTGWNGDNLLEKLGTENFATFTGKTVEIDENILTANGPSATEAAALNFLLLLEKRSRI